MNILVTGATGFLGTALTKVLAPEHKVVQLNSRNADLTRADSLKAFSSTKFDQVYHLAAWTQAGDFCIHHPGEQWIRNQQINTNVLQWWAEEQPQARLMFMGTSCSYDPDMPLSEENYLVGEPIDSLYTYAMTKRMLFVGAKALAKQFGLQYVTFVPSTLYGPGYHTDGRQMHFIFDLIRKILRAKKYGEHVVLWGDGHQKREIVYVDDFVSCMLRANELLVNDIVNVGAGEEFSIRRFAQDICELVDYDPSLITYDTSKYVGAKSKCLDVTRLRSVLPEFRPTPLVDGLQRTIAWFEAAKAY
jgi:GDP-L-fucose synthase